MKLIQLNIEVYKHFDKVLSFLKRESPDTLCLEEVPESFFELLKTEFGFEGVFVPMVYYPSPTGSLEKMGIALLTKNKIVSSQDEYYQKRQEALPVGSDPNDLERLHHALLSVVLEEGNKKYVIGVTHFPKNHDGGVVSDFQKKVFGNLSKLLDNFPELILTGDFNCPRGTELFDTLAKRLCDNIPKNVLTTLDLKLHRVRPLYYVVDVLFTTPSYRVKDVRLQDGVSDHLAIICQIERV